MHSHTAKTTVEHCFSGPVRDHQNPMAHGNIVEIATCSCGAIRRTNINGRHVERGPWDVEVCGYCHRPGDISDVSTTPTPILRCQEHLEVWDR